MPKHLSPAAFAAVVVLAASLPATFTLSPAIDPDSWWHLRVGKCIRDAGAVPNTDQFSRLGRESPTQWAAYSWLYEVGLNGAFDRGGLTGLMVARTGLCALSAAAVIGFVAWRVGPTPAGAAAVLLAAVVLMPFARERPWHFTIAFTVITAAAVARCREGELGRAWWLPLLFVLWSNVHIQFVLGWVVLGLACAFPGRADRRRLLLLTTVCVLATAVNPYHFHLFRVVWDYATQTGPLRAVHELAPPDFSKPWPWAAFALMGWAAYLVARRKPLDGFAVGLLIVGVVLSLRMRRDLWFGVVASLAAWPAVRTDTRPPWRGAAFTVLVVVVYFFARVLHLVGFGPSSDFPVALAKTYPKRAVDFTREQGLTGPLFNPFDWGGYLIWAMPEHPVSIDGRTNLYGSERVTRSMNTWAGVGRWDEDPELKSANLVVAPAGLPLTEKLRDRPSEWAIAFEDGVAVVFVRALTK